MRDRLIGRERELARVEAALRPDAGRDAHLLFEGTPGSGKTALLQATAGLAERRGYRVVWAQAHPMERTFPFGVVRQLLDQLLADSGRGQTEIPAASEVGELVARSAAPRPVLLAVDDVQWSDRESLDWLTQLVAGDPAAHVRVVVTRSPVGGASDADGLTDGLTGGLAAVAVPGLGEDDVAALAGDLLGAAADASFVRDCHLATNGTALLVAELLRATAAEAVPRARTGAAATLPARVPRRITRWVTSRMGRVSAQGVRLAQAVVVLGESAELPLVAELAVLDMDRAVAVAAALAGAGFLTPDGSLRFTHPVVRDAIDQLIAPGSRRVAHAAAAAIVYEARGPADAVAGHLLATDPVGRRWAAETLRAVAGAEPCGSVTAASHLRRALREPVDGALRAELLAELGHAELYAAAASDRRRALAMAIEHLAEAFDAAREPSLLARVAEDLAVAHYHDGARDRAMRVVDHAVARLAAGDQDGIDAPDGLAALGLAMAGPGDVAALAERFDRLRVKTDHHPDVAITVAAFSAARATAQGRADEALAQARLVAEAGPPRTPHRQFDHETAAAALCCADDLDLAARCAAGMIAQAARTGPAGFAAFGHALAAQVAFHEGRLAAAVEEARIAGAVQFSINGRAHAGARTWELAALLVMGDQSASAAILTDAGLLGERRTAAGLPRGSGTGAGSGPSTGSGPGSGSGADDAEPADDALLGGRLLSARGLLRELRGDLDCALDDHLASGRRLTAVGIVNPVLLPWRSRAALVSHRLGRRDAALRLATEELGVAARWGTPRAIGVAMSALGVAAGGPDGLSLLEESVALLARSPARVDHAGALYDLGRLLGESGRREDARPLLHESHRLATGCGARPLADLCALEIKRVGGRRSRALAAGAAALTLRERRIAERAVAGATNREIAEEFYLTVRTVEAHLTGVYRKLGIAGRAQLAAGLAEPPR